MRSWSAAARMVVLGVLVGIGCGVAFLVAQPRHFAAEALLVPTSHQTDVQFEPTIKTVSDSTVPDGAATPPNPQRLQALADLSGSSLVEAGAQQILAQQNSTGSAAGSLGSHITATLKPRSEVISIQADASTSADAIDLANAWASSYADAVRTIYGSGAASADYAQLTSQRDAALKRVNDAENALVRQLKQSNLSALQHEVADKEHTLTVMQSWYGAGGFTDGTAATVVDFTTARGDYRLADLQTINGLAGLLRHLEDVQQSLQVLAANEASTRAPGDSDTVAVALVAAQLVSMPDSGSLPTLKLELPTRNPGDGATSARQLLDAVNRAIPNVSKQLDDRRVSYESSRTAAISQLEEDVRQLNARIEAARAVEHELTSQRDLAWSSYSALANKVQERAVAAGAASEQVVLVSRATTASMVTLPVPQVMFFGAVAGLALGIAMAWLVARLPIVTRDIASPRTPLRGSASPS